VSEFTSEEERLLCHLYLVLDVDVPNCGCGWPQAARELVWELLALMPTYGDQKKRHLREMIGPEGSQQIVLCALEEAELITHGMSVDSAALAPRGRWVLWAIEQVGGTASLDAKLETAGYPHTDRECDASCWAVPDDWMTDEEPPGPPETGQRADFDGLGPLLDGLVTAEQYLGWSDLAQLDTTPQPATVPLDPLQELLEQLNAVNSLPPACPGSTCLLHGTEHQHAGRQR
jgi:hypothetical protein